MLERPASERDAAAAKSLGEKDAKEVEELSNFIAHKSR
jgi:hypothetical protein